MSYPGTSEKSKGDEDFKQMPRRTEPVDPKILKDIRDTLLQNDRDVAKKYNKADLDAQIKMLYKHDTVLPFAPINYNEEKKGNTRADSNPANHRTGLGQLFRYKTLDEAENAQHTIKDGVNYNYLASSADRDLESGLYDFSNRNENYDPEKAGLGGKATRKANKHRKSHKSKKTRKSRGVRKSKKARKTRK